MAEKDQRTEKTKVRQTGGLKVTFLIRHKGYPFTPTQSKDFFSSLDLGKLTRFGLQFDYMTLHRNSSSSGLITHYVCVCVCVCVCVTTNLVIISSFLKVNTMAVVP